MILYGFHMLFWTRMQSSINLQNACAQCVCGVSEPDLRGALWCPDHLSIVVMP